MFKIGCIFTDLHNILRFKILITIHVVKLGPNAFEF